ncbi:MAG TPA: hypothetical protein VFZ22_05695 [Pyrinomonadaceae bacterium]|nr:hypothetical protein [Pyrinomonadaceae bacterium]
MRLVKVIILTFVFSVVAVAAEPVRLLPNQLGKFKYSAPIENNEQSLAAGGVAYEEADYTAPGGSRIRVHIQRFPQDSKAYEQLSLFAAFVQTKITPEFGTAGFAVPDYVAFFKGNNYVTVRMVRDADASSLAAAAQEVSATLDKGEADIPVLIKHLPNPDEAQKTAVFLHSFENLESLVDLELDRGMLSAIDSRGNADAAFAAYGQSKVLIIEFNTPQLAKENDERIIARIQERWKLGQPAPTAYKRVGNYSVFVFDAPDEATAKQLIDQVKYEQVVQWLGENPNILKEAEKYYVNTTLGVLVAVIKASGYALLACLGLGGLAGALLFSYRRNQNREVAAFSDAGGMLRLNLDELTPETNPARLLRDRN